MTEPAILTALDAALHSPRAAVVLALAADEVAAELARTPDARLAWRPIPLSIYDRLPGGIASSWVFVLRAGCTSGAERHPNSIQRFMSFRGAADMQVWGPRYAPGKPAGGQAGWSRPSALQSNAETEAASAAGVPLHRAWLSNYLISDPEAPLDRRWLSIPLNTWHRPVMGAEDWTVVSFHTAPDDQLIEERPADDENPDAGLLASLPYTGRHAR